MAWFIAIPLTCVYLYIRYFLLPNTEWENVHAFHYALMAVVGMAIAGLAAVVAFLPAAFVGGLLPWEEKETLYRLRRMRIAGLGEGPFILVTEGGNSVNRYRFYRQTDDRISYELAFLDTADVKLFVRISEVAELKIFRNTFKTSWHIWLGIVPTDLRYEFHIPENSILEQVKLT